MSMNNAVRKSLPLVLVFLVVFGLVINARYSRAADPTCTASLTWDKSSINKGESATESWAITGADSASGACTDGGDINTTVSNLSFGPQSYTFKNIQKTLACTVTGYINGKAACSASDAVTVNTATTPPPGDGTERCWFDKPGQLGYLFLAQDSDYTTSVNPDICWAVQSGQDKIDMCSGDLHWTAVNGSAWNAPALSESDYSATLNGGSFHNQAFKVSDGVRLTRAELLQNNKYTATIKKKDGSTAATCSVQFLGVTPPTGPTQIPITVGVFPAPGDYTVNAGDASIQASYKYAPQVPGVFTPTTGFPGPLWVSDNGFGTFLGQFQKAIYFVIGHEPGAYGAWDLTDPMNPKGPTLQAIATNNGLTGPVQHLWPHASHGIGAMVQENEDGTARMINKNGLVEFYGNSYICGTDPVWGYPVVCHASYNNGPTSISVHNFAPGGQPSFGQQIEVYESTVPLAVYATEEGNFFGYSSQGNKVNIFDLADTTGSANPPYLKPSGTIAWSNVSSMHITNIPGRSTQFLVARLKPIGNSKSTWKVAELSSETGKVLKQKTVNFSNVTDPTGQFGSAGNDTIESATISNSTYIFVVEKVDTSHFSTNFNLASIANVTVGAYKFNPSDMSVTRKGSITVKSAGILPVGEDAFFALLKSESNTAYPLLAFPRFKKIGTGATGEDGVDVYATQKMLSGGDYSPEPTFNLPFLTQWPVAPGNLIVNNWPLNGFLKKEGSKVNMYIYRNAFYYAGKADTTNGISFSWTDQLGPTNSPYDRSWGNPTIRVDKVDVTGLTASTPPPSGGGGGNPGGGGNTGGGGGGGTTPPSGACYAQYPNDLTLRTLCQQIEAIKKQICALKPELSMCSSL